MEQESSGFFSSSMFWILLSGVVLYLYLKSKKIAKQKAEAIKQQQQITETQSEANGIQATMQASGRVADVAGEGMVVEGDTVYKGTTGGVTWSLVSSVRVSSTESADRPGRQLNQAWKRKSVWQTDFVKWPTGKFLLLMAAPGYDSAKHPLKRGGLFSKLVNMAADFALDIYVGGYFGERYKKIVNIGDDAIKIDRKALNGFLILTNYEGPAEKFLTEVTSEGIAKWRNSKAGFTRESAVDNFGLLVCETGILLGCQSDMANAEEANKLAEFASAISLSVKQVS
jgi:hypothetical protein